MSAFGGPFASLLAGGDGIDRQFETCAKCFWQAERHC